MGDQSFPKSLRLLKKADFDRVFQRRRSRSDHLLVVYACENGLPYSRLGLAVSRRYGDAVRRNRWKRCVREAFRLSREELPAGVDFVVLPRGAGQSPSTRKFAESLRRLAARVARDLSPPLPAPEPPAQ